MPFRSSSSDRDRGRETKNAPREELSFGGFQYRWNYDEYQRNLEIRKKKANSPGVRVFFVTLTTVLLFCFLSALALAFRGPLLSAIYGAFGMESPLRESESAAPIPSYLGSAPGTVYVSQDGPASAGLTITQIAEKGKPWVVGILSENDESGQVGTGIILTEDGYIATSQHVVDRGQRFSVITDDEEQYTARLVGTDVISDLAVLKIDARSLPTAEIGDSDLLTVGETAVAIGTPAGITFAGTVTSGIISAINRNVDIYDADGNVTKTMTVIQTTASINHGNSGGPLLNANGQVIGINTMKLADGYEGIGFAIPINGAMPILESLIRDGAVTVRPNGSFARGHASAGITGEEITEMTADLYRLPQGVLIKLIDPDSGAAESGLCIGDIIICLDGEEVRTVGDIDAILGRFSPGDTIDAYIYRNGKYLSYMFTLDEE